MIAATLPLLSLLIWLPIAGGLLVLAFGRDDDNAEPVRVISLIVSLICLALAIVVTVHFDNQSYAMQFVEHVPWITTFNAYYHIGVDGISLPLILLTCLMTILVVIAGWRVIQNQVSQYMSAFLIMQGLICGAFLARDALLFYVFWEALLIPMFIIIGVWGGANRIYATIKFFLFTFFGSVFMLVALIYLYRQAGSFEISAFYNLNLGMHAQILIFIGFLLAFAVKVPMWPVHTWLPDAHVEAPTGGSVVLAAVMLKLGAYGLLRFSLPIVPEASMALSGLMIVLSLIAVVYIGFVAIVQTDMKKLIAYSSIAHMGFVTLGMFIVFTIMANNPDNLEVAVLGVEGAVIQMISHGFISGALFLCVGVLYDRLHSRDIKTYGGVANTMPIFAAMFMLFALANSGLPGTSGFVGEFVVILSAFQAHIWVAIIAGLTLILGPAYTLWMYKRVIFGEVTSEKVAGLSDISCRETFMLGILVVFVLVLGIWPAPLFDMMHVSVEHLLSHVIGSVNIDSIAAG